MRARRVTALAAAAALLVGGCGGDSPTPAEIVPRLDQALERVDEALADQRFRSARKSLRQLVQFTVEAREDGILEQSQADRVLAAAARLLSALPDPRRRSEPSRPEPTAEPAPDPAPAPEPVPEPSPAATREDEREEKVKEEEEKKEELQEKLEERREQREEERENREEEREKRQDEDSKGGGDGGNGHDGDSGPGNGHDGDSGPGNGKGD